MTVTNPNAATKDRDNWIKTAFTFTLGEDYTTMQQILANAIFDPSITAADNQKLQEVLNDAGGKESRLPVYYTKRKCRTTVLGGNDVINPLYQYCENDDIVHPFTSVDNSNQVGMGRVHSEELDDHQQVMWLSFGHPQFNNLTTFYSDAFNASLARIINQGPGAEGTSFGDIGELLGSGVTTLIALPVMPLVFLSRLVKGIDNVTVTRYYDFSSQMPLYYRTVNSILAHLAVGMGIARDNMVMDNFLGLSGASSSPGGSGGSDPNRQRTGSTSNAYGTYQEQYAAANAGSPNVQGMPDVFQRHGFDIYRILLQKYLYEDEAETSNLGSTDQALREQFGSTAELAVSRVIQDINTSDSTLSQRISKIWTSWKSTLYDAQMFIGFRVTSSTDSTESVSNTTGPSEVAQTLNSKMQAAASLSFTTGGWFDQSGVVDFLKGVGRGIGDGLSLSDISSAATGAGYFDIPEVWQGSNFSKSYTFNMKLRAPFGDPVSIFTREYVPLACLLAGGLPRQVGRNAYSSPFIVRAYCKGMFAVPLGMIDNINITRGADLHGWSNQRFPRVISISFTIKDLSPVMCTALASNSVLDEISKIFGSNSTFQEYLMTLSGQGLSERVLWSVGFKRRLATFMEMTYLNRLSPFAWGMNLGATTPARIITALNPSTRIASN